MAIEVETKDCTVVTDAEIDEMAALCADGPNPFSVGLLSKQTELWVLATTAREKGRLKGFVFSTLERIGGTPSVLLAIGAVGRTSKRNTVLRALMSEIFHRALMAFPDEDVLVGSRFSEASGFELFQDLEEIVPRPEHRTSGEERAWGRRLFKRLSNESEFYDDHSFSVVGAGEQACLFDHESVKPEKISAELGVFFEGCEPDRGDHLIAFAWAMADKLEKLGS